MLLHVSDCCRVTLCCVVFPCAVGVGGRRGPLMPRNVIQCIGCGKRQDKDKGHKYTVSNTEYLCQDCYNSDRNANEVLPLSDRWRALHRIHSFVTTVSCCSLRSPWMSMRMAKRTRPLLLTTLMTMTGATRPQYVSCRVVVRARSLSSHAREHSAVLSRRRPRARTPNCFSRNNTSTRLAARPRVRGGLARCFHLCLVFRLLRRSPC
jgi:hypothetical protein